jgi:hypothetical protein
LKLESKLVEGPFAVLAAAGGTICGNELAVVTKKGLNIFPGRCQEPVEQVLGSDFLLFHGHSTDTPLASRLSG